LCPVCLSRWVSRKNEGSFYGKGTLKENIFWGFLYVFGLLAAGAGVLACFNNKNDTAVGVTIFFFILGVLGFIKYQSNKQHNAFIQRRIVEFKETGKVPQIEWKY